MLLIGIFKALNPGFEKELKQLQEGSRNGNAKSTVEGMTTGIPTLLSLSLSGS